MSVAAKESAPTRWDVERAVVAANIPAPAKLIVLALLTQADNDSATIPEKRKPSLSDIAAMTGLSRAAVAKHLNALELAGWVARDRPSATEARKGAKTDYQLHVGIAGDDYVAATLASPPLRLVHQGDQQPSPPERPASPPERPASPRGGLALVHEVDGGSPRGGRKRYPSSTPSLPSKDSPANQDSLLPSLPPPRKPPEPGSDDDPHFVEFWQAYPSTRNKGAARRAWKTAIKKLTPTELVAAAKRYRDDPNRTRNPQYIPHASTWLNNERWADGPEPPRDPPAGNNGHKPHRDPENRDDPDFWTKGW